MNLKKLDMLALQTSFMQNDDTTIALCKALTPKYQELANDISNVIIYSKIDQLSESLIDELAYHFHVDFYDYSLSLDVKRELVKSSRRLHCIKGTPGAVEDAIKTVFGRAWVEEWFEYNGDPYKFKVNVEATNRGASIQDWVLLEKLINAYKNKRSWIEKINIYLTGRTTTTYALATNSGEEITVYPWSTTKIFSKGTMEVAIGNNTGLETITLYPKKGVV